jgi:hypothetical protein
MTYVDAIYRLTPRPVRVLIWLGLVAVVRVLDVPVDLSELTRMIPR